MRCSTRLGSIKALLTWAVRPEKLALAGSGDRAESGKIAITPAKVVKYTYLGREAHVLVDTVSASMIVHLSNPGDRNRPVSQARTRAHPSAMRSYGLRRRRQTHRHGGVAP
jgi:hypothetical protein